MTVDHEDIQRELTKARALAPGTVAALAEVCRKCADAGGVDAQRIPFDPDRWGAIATALPQEAHHERAVTRAQVREVAEDAITSGEPLTLLAAAYIFGQGRNGYGPARYRSIVTDADTVTRKLTAALDRLRTSGPVDSYAQLWGGDGEHRANPDSREWNRIAKLGPAFFTKVLYFADRSALILDQVLARRVAALTGLRYFVDSRGRAVAWTSFRYSVYLAWMAQTAQQLSDPAGVRVSPDLLELALFGLESKIVGSAT